jgi:hypothetical protein
MLRNNSVSLLYLSIIAAVEDNILSDSFAGQLTDALAYQNRTSMVALHANYVVGNRVKMMRMHEHGLWIAVPSYAGYSPSLNVTDEVLNGPHIISDKDGNRYNLEHLEFGPTKWGKCIDFDESKVK